MNNRCYIVTTDMSDDGMILAIVGKSIMQVRNDVYRGKYFLEWDEFISIHIKWKKSVDVSDLPLGEMDLKEGLLRGAYGYLLEFPCERCKRLFDPCDDNISNDRKILCEDCMPLEGS